PGSNVLAQIGVFSVALFAGCMICHGELVRLKPATKHLTLFYLLVSMGGALGGLFVVVLAPAIFKNYWEFQLGVAGCAVLMLVALAFDPLSWLHQTSRRQLIPFLTTIVLTGLCAYYTAAFVVAQDQEHAVLRSRNFF